MQLEHSCWLTYSKYGPNIHPYADDTLLRI